MTLVPTEVVCIAAYADNRIIGANNMLPWHLSSDLKRFKSLTLGHPIIMGRRTFESLGNRPLPGRRNIVVSQTEQPGVETFPSLDAALAACGQAPLAFVSGGARLYAAALEQGLATRLELTRVFLSPQGDAAFPAFEHAYALVASEVGEEKGLAFRYETWLKKP